MIDPVDHIVGGKHHQRLDLFVGVVLILALFPALLVVVGAVDIEPAVVLHGGRVGTEHLGGNRVVVKR